MRKDSPRIRQLKEFLHACMENHDKKDEEIAKLKAEIVRLEGELEDAYNEIGSLTAELDG